MNNATQVVGLVLSLLASGASVATSVRSLTAAERQHEIGLQADRVIPRLLADSEVPSASLAHIEAGEVVFTGAYGFQAPGVRANSRTLYNVASLSKPISAEVVLRLASQGRVSLDEPMYLYWTDPDIANDERRKLLTPRLAMSHQTGFPNWRGQTGNVLTFKHEPGQVLGYSGEGYEYLARFAQKKTGADFERLAQELVLGPVGMTETTYTRRPWLDGRIALPTDAHGHLLEPQIADRWIASDLVYTTPNDYARFMLSVMRGDGLTVTIARERNRIQVVKKSDLCSSAKTDGCPEQAGFGLGWLILKIGGETYMTHNGSDKGVATFVYLNLNRQTGTVILTNSENGAKIVPPILALLGTDQVLVECMRRKAC